MPSYTTSLRLVQPSTGEFPGTWGTEVNTGLTALVDASIAGTSSITMTAANFTLTTANGASDQSRAMFLVLGGTPGASYAVIVPSVSKLYFVTNNTGFAQTVRTSGTGISVPNGASMTLRCDGTNVVVAENYFLFTSGSAALPSVAISGDADTGMWSPAANTLAWSNNGAETMRLDSSGNLGLGVTPSAWVGDKSYQVNWGSISSGYDYGVNLNSVAYRSNTTWYYQVTGQAPARYEQLGGNHRWFSAPSGTAGGAISFTNTMTLDSSGNLLRGQTSSGNLNSRGFYSDAAGYFGQNHLNTDASGSFYAYFGFNGGTIGSITQSGTTAVLYNTTSDQRLKTNIVDAPDAAALIDSIKVRSFDWISDETHQRYGFIAQELVAVAPEAVHAPADPDEMMAVDYSKLVPMLIKEIQSLRARVAALEQV